MKYKYDKIQFYFVKFLLLQKIFVVSQTFDRDFHRITIKVSNIHQKINVIISKFQDLQCAWNANPKISKVW